ncbi:unnamed protein product [Moneuplotes crassus]|uniref:Uncharacterized protein n=1 Tax=Euplotes crassus TaxID=5936 RepID=A0AAD1Y9F3_EUPCR|nr:unnamed protein product [Moneuplotes crassus]
MEPAQRSRMFGFTPSGHSRNRILFKGPSRPERYFFSFGPNEQEREKINDLDPSKFDEKIMRPFIKKASEFEHNLYRLKMLDQKVESNKRSLNLCKNYKENAYSENLSQTKNNLESIYQELNSNACLDIEQELKSYLQSFHNLREKASDFLEDCNAEYEKHQDMESQNLNPEEENNLMALQVKHPGDLLYFKNKTMRSMNQEGSKNTTTNQQVEKAVKCQSPIQIICPITEGAILKRETQKINSQIREFLDSKLTTPSLFTATPSFLMNQTKVYRLLKKYGSYSPSFFFEFAIESSRSSRRSQKIALENMPRESKHDYVLENHCQEKVDISYFLSPIIKINHMCESHLALNSFKINEKQFCRLIASNRARKISEFAECELGITKNTNLSLFLKGSKLQNIKLTNTKITTLTDPSNYSETLETFIRAFSTSEDFVRSVFILKFLEYKMRREEEGHIKDKMSKVLEQLELRKWTIVCSGTY